MDHKRLICLLVLSVLAQLPSLAARADDALEPRIPAAIRSNDTPVLPTEPPATPASLEAQGDVFFGNGRYREAADVYQMAVDADPTADRAWKLAMARWGTHDGLGALTAVDQVLARDPAHKAAKQARPLLAEWVRVRGSSGTAVPLVPAGRSIRMAVLQALVDGDDVLARQLLPLWRSGPERGVVAELVQAEIFLRDDRLVDADRVLRAILAKQPGHPGAMKALTEVVIRRGELQQARAMIGLSALRDGTLEDPNADLYRYVLRRRAEWQQQIRMAVDPGVKPLPALQTQLAESAPRPVVTPAPEPAPPPEPPPPPPKKRGGQARHVHASPSPSKTLMTRAHKPAHKKKK